MSWRTLLLALGYLTAFAVQAAVQAPPAFAFRLIPIEMEFATAGRGATRVFRVENDRSDPAAIEIRMMARAMETDGADRLTPADDDFAVYPAQIVLMPGESRSVRVQYVGKPGLSSEAAFRLVAEQLPVDLGGEAAQGGQVRLLVRYVASVYVVPDGAKPDLRVVGAARATADGRPVLEIVVENRGTSRQILGDPVVEVSGEVSGVRRSVTLTGAQLEGLAGENVLAAARRRFLLPWPEDLGPLTGSGSLTASLRIAP